MFESSRDNYFFPPWTTGHCQHATINWHIDQKRTCNYHFHIFTPFRQSVLLIRTINPSCVPHMPFNHFFLSLLPLASVVEGFWKKKKLKNKKKHKKETKKRIKGKFGFLSPISTSNSETRRRALEGVDFPSSKNVVFTEEWSNIWGAHMPLWSTGCFKTSFTEKNFGWLFWGCVNYKVRISS
jgi:hypothetical protein